MGAGRGAVAGVHAGGICGSSQGAVSRSRVISDLSAERKLSLRAEDALRRHPVIRVLLLVLPAIVSSLAAYTGSELRNDHVDDKATAGYQVTHQHVEDLRTSSRALQARLIQLEADLEVIRKAQKAAKRPIPPAKPPTAGAVKALQLLPPMPATLDKALEQVQTPVPPVPAP